MPIGNFRTRYVQLCKQFRVTAKVLDMQPYVETILNLQQNDANLFAGIFVTRKGLALYDTTTREENEKAGKMAIKQVSINKNAVLDMVLDELRSGQIKIRKTADWPDVKAQLISMKRVKQVTDDGVQYVWRKPSDGDDHFHMALLYLYLAVQLRQAARAGTGVPPMVGSFKLRPPKSEQIRTGTGMR